MRSQAISIVVIPLLATALLLAMPGRIGVGTASADTVIMKSGGKLEGTVVDEGPSWILLKTRFGTQKVERSRIREIVPGKTREQDLAARRAILAPDDAAGHVALARWAEEQKMRKEARELWGIVVRLEPDNAPAHQALGHVRFEGAWYSPAEAERLRELDYTSRGFVRYEGEWIHADELAGRQLAQREKARKDKEAAREAEAEGPAIPDPSSISDEIVFEADNALARQCRVEIEDAIGVTPLTLVTEHFVFVSTLDAETTRELAIKAEVTIRWVFRFFENSERMRPWSGKGRYYLLDNASNYEDFVSYIVPKHIKDERFLKFLQASQARGEIMGMSARAERTPFAADFDHENTPWDNLIHTKVSTYCLENYCGTVPAWLRTGWAAFVEFQFTGASRVRSLTNTSYGGRADLADKAGDSAHWTDLLLDAVEYEEDTHFVTFKNRGLNQLDYMDLSKSWSIITFLVQTRKAGFVDFCRKLRRSNQDEAFHKAFGADHEAIDTLWREWITDQ